MTVCVAVKCKDGLVMASDSLATFGRGVPVLRYANKVDVLRHDGLENPVAVAAAGTIAFYDKFKRRALRTGIEAARKTLKHKLDIIDFCDAVGVFVHQGAPRRTKSVCTKCLFQSLLLKAGMNSLRALPGSPCRFRS